MKQFPVFSHRHVSRVRLGDEYSEVVCRQLKTKISSSLVVTAYSVNAHCLVIIREPQHWSAVL